MVNFSTRTLDYESHSCPLLGLFLSFNASIFSTMAFPTLRNSDHVVVSVFIDFRTNSKLSAPFHHIADDFSHADLDSFCDHLKDVSWENIFKLSTSAAAASEFCD